MKEGENVELETSWPTQLILMSAANAPITTAGSGTVAADDQTTSYQAARTRGGLAVNCVAARSHIGGGPFKTAGIPHHLAHRSRLDIPVDPPHRGFPAIGFRSILSVCRYGVGPPTGFGVGGGGGGTLPANPGHWVPIDPGYGIPVGPCGGERPPHVTGKPVWVWIAEIGPDVGKPKPVPPVPPGPAPK